MPRFSNTIYSVIASIITILSLIPFVPVSGATQVEIGSTWYDLQHGSSMGRQIAIGGDGRIHFAWTQKMGPSSSDLRSVYYNVYDPISGLLYGSGATGGKQVSTNVGRYVSVGVFQNRALLAWHEGSAGTPHTVASLDSVASLGVFATTSAPLPNCSGTSTGVPSENNYIWPIVDVDQDGVGNPVAHIVACENKTYPGDVQSLVYYRATGQSLNFGTCGVFIDSVLTVSPIVCSDPNSDHVAIVYCQPISMQTYDENIVYVESSDLGQTWGSKHNVTNYTAADKERAFAEVTALYTLDGCLHIVWPTQFYDSPGPDRNAQISGLYHWDACGKCKSLIVDAPAVSSCGSPGNWISNIAYSNLSECQGRLYCSYDRFAYPDINDCGADGSYQGLNGEIFLSASTDNGLSWGVPTNLTNTQTPRCTAGNCLSEICPSMPPYCNDSLHLIYVEDLDAGMAVDADGTWTENPVMYMTYPCVLPPAGSLLTVDPDSLGYPLWVVPDSTHDTTVVLMNSGNTTANYTRSVQYVNGSGWIDFPNHPSASGAVLTGCSYADTLTVRFHGPHSEGAYRAFIRFVYNNGVSADTSTIPVTMYVTHTYCLPIDYYLRTTCNKLRIGPSGQFAGLSATGERFTYFSDNLDYLNDASLILGNSPTNLSEMIFKSVSYNCGVQSSGATGVFVAIPGTTSIDSTSIPSYRLFTTQAFNRDSTLQIKLDVMAPKHADSCDFYVARYQIFKGINSPLGTVSGLIAAFAADWDVPSDTGHDNSGGFDAARQLLYQRGAYSAPNNQRFAAIGAYRDNSLPITGGFVWENDAHVIPGTGFNDSDLWSKMAATTTYQTIDSVENLNSVLVLGKNLSVNGANHDTLKYIVVLAAEPNGTVSDVENSVVRARSFFCAHYAYCFDVCYGCGDANGDNNYNISDAIYLIQYIFASGPAPNPVCRGDANADTQVNISDAVYILLYIFAGGPAPHCQG